MPYDCTRRFQFLLPVRLHLKRVQYYSTFFLFLRVKYCRYFRFISLRFLHNWLFLLLFIRFLSFFAYCIVDTLACATFRAHYTVSAFGFDHQLILYVTGISSFGRLGSLDNIFLRPFVGLSCGWTDILFAKFWLGGGLCDLAMCVAAAVAHQF
jgi:hypothetical protein